jgi:hypothetical protein
MRYRNVEGLSYSYLEDQSVCPFFGIRPPPTPSPHSECVSPLRSNTRLRVREYTVKNAVELLGAFRPDVEKIQYH